MEVHGGQYGQALVNEGDYDVWHLDWPTRNHSFVFSY